MIKREISIQRISVVSSKTFDEVMAALDAAIGHPEAAKFRNQMTAAKSYEELEKVVAEAAGPSGLIEFTRFDLGGVLKKKHGANAPRCVRLVIGNPVIMAQLVEHTPDAGSYAPVTILVDERGDRVHISYDLMARLLAPYADAEALGVARDLDAKVEAFMKAAA
jgi:uncharacterized protein (DUF302 family)